MICVIQGHGDWGLGLDNYESVKNPRLITSLQSIKVFKVACGSRFTAALTKEGKKKLK
jgi:alpha-tubulin suppressor-like RCC1 family protein